jgi:hypothetical protein
MIVRASPMFEFSGLKRRDFLALLGGTAISWSLVGHARQKVMPVIGFLSSDAPDTFASLVAARGWAKPAMSRDRM